MAFGTKWDREMFSSSDRLKHAVVQINIVYRLRWSIVRLSQIKPDTDPICEWCGRNPATILHMILTSRQSIVGNFSEGK